MRPKTVATHIPALDIIADDFVQLMRAKRQDDNNEVPNYQNAVYKWALESVASFVLDTRLGCLQTNPDPHPDSEPVKMIQAVNEFFRTSGKLVFGFPFYKFFSTPTWRRLLKCEDVFFSTTEKYVDRALSKLANTKMGRIDEKGRASFLMTILQNKELTQEEATALPIELMFGGVDTTSHVLIFTSYNLATNPDKQEKLLEELSRVLPNKSAVTEDALQNLPYVKACVKETLRMFPLVIGTVRYAEKDLVLSGYRIPKGTHVSSHNIHGWLPEYYSNPSQFKPERWLKKGDENHEIHPYLFLPFGHGVRQCLGRRLAEYELYIMISKLIQNFSIEWHHGKMGMLMRLTQMPDTPARFSFIDRK